jgi:hypothetical protein
MTLQDAFTSYTARLHRKALRPHLGWRVVNPDNDLRARLSLRAAQGDGVSLPSAPSPTIFSVNAHGACMGDFSGFASSYSSIRTELGRHPLQVLATGGEE